MHRRSGLSENGFTRDCCGPECRSSNTLRSWPRFPEFAAASGSRGALAIFSRRTIEVPAKDPVQMTLVGKAAEERDLLERQIVPSQMPARLLYFLFLNKSVRAYPIVSVE